MRKRSSELLKKNPFSFLLVVIFAFFHSTVNAYEWLNMSNVYKPFILVSLGTFIVFIIIFLLLKSALKATIYTTFLFVLFFYFNYFQNGIKSFSGMYMHLRYSGPVIVLLLIALLSWISKQQIPRLERINYFINLLLIIYLLIDSGYLAHHIYTKQKKEFAIESESETFPQSGVRNNTGSLPDIYFLVFDEYASSVSLKKNFGYDNTDLDTFLTNKDFYTAAHSKSNYTLTAFSISSTLNMNYFKYLPDPRTLSAYFPAWRSMKGNRLFSVLQNDGYEIYNYSVFDFNDHPGVQYDFMGEVTDVMMMGKSLNHAFGIAYDFLNKRNHSNRIKKLLHLVEEAGRKSNKPKFIYLHIMLPHSPFVFNANGTIRSVFKYSQTLDAYSQKNYVNQLIFTNSVIKKTINIIMNSNKPKVIVLEGDHGYRGIEAQNGIKDISHFQNLNAYYFYDKNYLSLYDSITSVNSFRIILNQYLNKHYTVLKDSTVF